MKMFKYIAIAIAGMGLIYALILTANAFYVMYT